MFYTEIVSRKDLLQPLKKRRALQNCTNIFGAYNLTQQFDFLRDIEIFELNQFYTVSGTQKNQGFFTQHSFQ